MNHSKINTLGSLVFLKDCKIDKVIADIQKGDVYYKPTKHLVLKYEQYRIFNNVSYYMYMFINSHFITKRLSLQKSPARGLVNKYYIQIDVDYLSLCTLDNLYLENPKTYMGDLRFKNLIINL